MITDHAEGTFANLRYTLGGDHPSQTTHHALFACLTGVRTQLAKGWYFNVGSTTAGTAASKPPTYPTHQQVKPNAKL